MKQFQIGTLGVTILDSREEMGTKAAEDAAAYLRALLMEQEQVTAVFAAAPSQNEFLAALLCQAGIDWSRVRALHMDEYVGLAQDAEQTFAHYLETHFFAHVPLRAVRYICRCGKTAEEQCRTYARLLQDDPIDVVFMGIGENGHIAFNDPAVARFDDSALVKIVELDDVCRMQQVHDGCFPSLEDVPTSAVTLTIPAMLSAKRIFCIVPARSKARAVRETLCAEISERCPASILRRHEGASLYLDPESSELLPIGAADGTGKIVLE